MVLGTNKHLRALSVLKQPVDQWDVIIFGLVSTRLPLDVRKDWELQSSNFIEIPTWSELRQFIENRVHALNMLQYKHSGTNALKSKQLTRIAAHTGTEHHDNTNFSYSVCTQRHNIYKCNMVMTATPSNRLSIAKRAKLCFNCLRSTYSANKCTVKKHVRFVALNITHYCILKQITLTVQEQKIHNQTQTV